MKKIFFVLIMALLASSSMLAQTKEEIDESKKRSEKLASICEKLSSSSGLPSVDEFVLKVKEAATVSTSLTEQLQSFYYRQIGETEEGVTEVVEKKPTVEECVELSTTILAQSEIITGLVSSAAGISGDVTSSAKSNPIGLAKATKSMASATNACTILGKESAFQVKAIKEMIETAKSENNL